jgi:uncharacterized repeat protein (TIGR01451 family)
MRYEALKRTRGRFLYAVLIVIAAMIAGLGLPGLLSASDTIVCDAQPLIATNPTMNAQLGWSVSADGEWLAAGAIQDNTNPGSVALYNNPGTRTDRHPDQEIVADVPHPGDQFGASVSISFSNNAYWLAVGAPMGNGRVQDSGVVYLFQLVPQAEGSKWVQVAKLEAGDAARGAQFGFSVSLNGTTLVVGAPTDSGGGSFAGAAYVFELPSATSGPWNQTAKLLANDFRPFDEFGSAVATDGSEIVVGSPFADDLTVFKNFGAAYVFTRAGGGWTLENQGKLTAGTFRAGNIQFGAAVAIRSGLIGVGAPGYDNTNPILTDSGSAYVFERNVSTGLYGPAILLIPEDLGESAQFGTAVQIASNSVVIGAPFAFDRDGVTRVGAVYLFEQSNNVWNQKFKILHTLGGAFGKSVAALGDQVFMGGFQYPAAGMTDSGAVAVCPGSVPPCPLPPPAPSISRTDHQAAVQPGQTVTYRIDVVAAPPGTTVSESFPPQLEAVGWCSGAHCTNFVQQPFTDTLSAGGDASYLVRGRVRADATGEITNNACENLGVCPQACMKIVDTIQTTAHPILVVTKDDGLTQVSPGQTVTYTIKVENVGDGAAPAVAVTDVFSPKLQNVSWTDQTISLAAGRSAVFTATGTVTQNACGTLTNRACAQLLPDGPTVCGDDAPDQIVQPVDLALTNPIANCSTLSYTLVITNPRPAASGSVQVTAGTGNGLTPTAPIDPHCQVVAANIVCTLDSVAGNTTVNIPVYFRIPQCYAGPNPILVAAVLGTNCDPAHDQRSLAIPVVCKADLAITKTHDPAVLVPGQAMAYVITVRNNGPSDVPGATVTDSLPNALLGPHCVGANRLDCTFLVNNLNIAVGPLPVGGEASYRIEGQLTSQCISTLSNTATVSPAPSCIVDPDLSNNTATDTATIPTTSGVSIHCSGPSDAFEGDFVTFTYVLSNGGPNAQAANPGAEFTDTLPAGLTLVTATASSGAVMIAANTVTWNGSIPVCGTVTIYVQATVNAGTAGMTLCNQGNIFFDANGDGINESNASATCCVSIHATPPPPKIPTLGPAGLVALLILLACVALLRLRRRRV